MSKIVIALAFLAGLIAGQFLNLSSKSLHAQQRSSCGIPKSYGSLKTSVQGMLIFEQPDGTLRLIEMFPCRVQGVITRN